MEEGGGVAVTKGRGKVSRDGEPQGRFVVGNLIGSYDGSLLGSTPVLNTGFGNRTIVSLALRGEYVSFLGSYDGVRGR